MCAIVNSLNCLPLSGVFSRIEELSGNEQKIHVVAWAVLSVIASTLSVVIVTLAIYEVVVVSAALLSIPLLFLAGYGFWQSNYIDYEDSDKRLSFLRKEVGLLRFSQLKEKYGERWCEIVIESKLLTPLQFESAYRQMVGEEKWGFQKIITSYQRVHRFVQGCNVGRSVIYTVPHPKEWMAVWQLEVAEKPFAESIEMFPALQQLGLLDARQEERMRHAVSRYRKIQNTYDQLAAPVYASHKLQEEELRKAQELALAAADQAYHGTGAFPRLAALQQEMEKRRVAIINEKFEEIQRIAYEYAQLQRALTNGGKRSYRQLSQGDKISYDRLQEERRVKEAQAEERRRDAEQHLIASNAAELDALTQAEVAAKATRDRVKREILDNYSVECEREQRMLREQLAPLNVDLDVAAQDLKIIYTQTTSKASQGTGLKAAENQ